MSLEQWQQNAWLVSDQATLPEITQLFAVVDRELQDAELDGISVDGRFMHAYDASLILCMIALRASGYRVPKGSGHHKRSIESLPLTVGPHIQTTSDQIEIASRKRGQAMYDRAGVVDERDADELAETARALRLEVIDWLKSEHPNLLPAGL